MRSFRAWMMLVGLVVGLLGLALAPSASVAAKGAGRPYVEDVTASPSAVPSSGGIVTVSGKTSNASTCSLSSHPRITGLPVTFSCNKESFTRKLTLPRNRRTSTMLYTFHVKASGPGGKSRFTQTFTVTEHPAVRDGEGEGGETGGETVATEVVSGEEFSCALIISGRIRCWGYGADGELGNGSKTREVWSPVSVLDLTDATQISAGGNGTCAVLSDHQLYCWGGNYGTPGPEEENEGADTPVASPISDAAQVSVHGGSGCAVLTDGHVDCWGGGPHEGSYPSFAEPAEVSGIATATEVAVGSESACAVLSSGGVDCWGDDEYGQLGVGTTSGPEMCAVGPEPYTRYGACSLAPVAVEGISNAVQVSVTGLDEKAFACALLASGHIDCWGSNEDGQLGDGTTNSSDVPAEVEGISDATHLSTAYEVPLDDACAVLASGHLECWGNDDDAQLGNELHSYYEEGVLVHREYDVPVEARIENVSIVAPSGKYTCALQSTGKVQCWGAGLAGGLGAGKELFGSLTPVEVLGL